MRRGAIQDELVTYAENRQAAERGDQTILWEMPQPHSLCQEKKDLGQICSILFTDATDQGTVHVSLR